MSRCWYCDEELTSGNSSEHHVGICTKCYKDMFRFGEDVIRELQNEIKILEKALELACEDVWNSDYECIQADYDSWQELVNVYKTNAKEMMKSE